MYILQFQELSSKLCRIGHNLLIQFIAFMLKEGPENKHSYIGVTKQLHFLDEGK
jgi:hypothetical protein